MESHLLTSRVGIGSGGLGLAHLPGHSQHTECPALLLSCHQKMKPCCLPTTMSQKNRMWPAGTKLISQEIQSCHEHSVMFLCKSSACCCANSAHSDVTEFDMKYLSYSPIPSVEWRPRAQPQAVRSCLSWTLRLPQSGVITPWLGRIGR